MVLRRARRLALGVIFVPLAQFPLALSGAAAQPRTAEQRQQGQERREGLPQGASEGRPPEASEYAEELMQGLRARIAGDPTAAIVSFREAIRREPHTPTAHCHLAEALRATEALNEALASYRACARFAAAANAPIHEGRGLLGVVQTLLRTEARSGLREALTALTAFASRNPSVLAPSDSAALQQAFDAISELDATSAQVRQKREARAAQADENDDP